MDDIKPHASRRVRRVRYNQRHIVTGFLRHEGALLCDGVPLAELAELHGTPLYVYSAATIAARYRAIDDAFRPHPHALHYALKANSTLAIIRVLRGLGACADANSGGEIDAALRAGFIPTQIVFTGVGKTDAELAQAIDLGVKTINAESAGELERINRLAGERQVRARVALRVNPNIDARSHPHISTGLQTNKFGIALSDVRELSRRFRAQPGLDIVGLHIHVGSQIVDLEPLRGAAQALVTLARELRDDGIGIDHLDLGGGLGISYDGQSVPGPTEYAAALLPIVRDSGVGIILEPGRAIVGPAGVLVARVIDVKPQAGGKQFVILDAGMTELLRPVLYSAFHRIEPVTVSPPGTAGARDVVICDVVGPLCESSDTLGRDRQLPEPGVGDLMAIFDVGAYGSVMASNYNRRPMPAEVLVNGRAASLIRRRQTIDDLVALET
jgi:diaminopimelate decarboxylase